MIISDVEIAIKYKSKHNHAKDTGKEFSLGLIHFIHLLQDSNQCAYTGVELNTDNCTLERVNPFIGYTEYNTVCATVAANHSKSLLDQFMKDKTIPIIKRVDLMQQCTQFLAQEMLKGRPQAPSLFEKYVVPTTRSLDLSDRFGVGSEFYLVSTSGAVKATLSEIEITDKIKHSRSFRELTFKKKVLITEDMKVISCVITRAIAIKICVFKNISKNSEEI